MEKTHVLLDLGMDPILAWMCFFHCFSLFTTINLVHQNVFSSLTPPFSNYNLIIVTLSQLTRKIICFLKKWFLDGANLVRISSLRMSWNIEVDEGNATTLQWWTEKRLCQRHIFTHTKYTHTETPIYLYLIYMSMYLHIYMAIYLCIYI
jgi:hypothetical protein